MMYLYISGMNGATKKKKTTGMIWTSAIMLSGSYRLNSTKLVSFNLVSIATTHNTQILSTSLTSKGFRNETTAPCDLTHTCYISSTEPHIARQHALYLFNTLIILLETFACSFNQSTFRSRKTEHNETIHSLFQMNIFNKIEWQFLHILKSRQTILLHFFLFSFLSLSKTFADLEIQANWFVK